MTSLSLRMPVENISYGDKYQDDQFEYRNVMLPSELAKHVPRNHLMTETEWRNLGVQQSPGEVADCNRCVVIY